MWKYSFLYYIVEFIVFIYKDFLKWNMFMIISKVSTFVVCLESRWIITVHY